MSIVLVLLTCIGFALSSFNISMAKGIAMDKFKANKALIIGLYFGIFQAIMLLLGYLFGNIFVDIVGRLDHYIILCLMGVIGLNVIFDTFKNNSSIDDRLDFISMLKLSLTIAIDLLGAGITFSFLGVHLLIAFLLTFLITFMINIIGVLVGNKCGNKCGIIIGLTSGIIIILIGVDILIEHLGII